MGNRTGMTSAELRASFIEFFGERGHLHVPSASLVPAEMATTLFTIAGMEPFVPMFLGHVPPPGKRAVSVQRCLRVAGAKSDIENVGRTGRHGTFLEMMGNFGFADYGKREAIAWAWEYITGRLGIDPARLYITVHTSDDEAETIWQNEIGVPAERISRFDEDNFWTMGPTGPCGPSSEIFYDTGAAYALNDADTGPNLGNRYVEIWNLVFQQYNREADGTLQTLSALNIDTGAGLERVLAVVNGRASMYETDLFTDLVEAQPPVGETSLAIDEQLVRRRIIADHARACTALIADGVFPSNADRGYVLRFLIRRAIRNGRLLGYPDGFLTDLVPAVTRSLVSGFPELQGAEERIAGVLGREEAIFERTLERGEALLLKMIEELRQTERTALSGADAFSLHDTFGFPIELTREILAEQALSVDHAGFSAEMDAQRIRARTDAAKKRGVVTAGEVMQSAHASEFHGYAGLHSQGLILEILRPDGTPVDEAIAGEDVRIILDKSSFYAERGGQIGDHGELLSGDARFVVDDTQAMGDAIVHHGRMHSGILTRGAIVDTVVDDTWRREIRRHHTSVHLLQHALRMVVGSEVVQAGSWVGPERMRFDFRSPSGALTPEQKLRVAEIVNEIIRDDYPVETLELSAEEARATGAITMPGENYGATVRVLKAGPSLEFCGGTHAIRTGEIGFFILLSEASIGSGIRRIEGLVSKSAERHVERQTDILSRLCAQLTAKPEDLPERVERLQNDIKRAEQAAQAARRSAMAGQADTVFAAREELGELSLVAARVEGDAEEQREVMNVLRSRLHGKPAVVVLFGAGGERVPVAAYASEEAVKRGAHAGNLLKSVLAILDGKGGGNAAQAQGAGLHPERIEAALAAVHDAAAAIGNVAR